jgi:hypothetical protein
MSDGAKRYLVGGKENRRNKRRQGNQITRNTLKKVEKTSSSIKQIASEHTAMTPEQGEYKYIRDLTTQTEIDRRVDVIRTELIRQILAPGGNPLLGNDLVTYINLLIQQPVLIFFYRKVNGTFSYQPHFDLSKFKHGRGSLKLFRYSFNETNNPQKNGDEIELGDLEVHEESNVRLFKVFNTNFYIRCFLLDTRMDDQPFYEVTTRHTSEMTYKYEYVRLCLQKLFDVNAKEIMFYSESFRHAIFLRVQKILDDFSYIPVKAGRSKDTLDEKNRFEKLEEFNFSKNSELDEKENAQPILQPHRELARRFRKTLEDASFSASFLKKNGIRKKNEIFNKDAANIFLMLRAYSRKERRAEEIGFRGYSYDTKFSVSNTQRKHVEEFFIKLAALGKTNYQTYGGANNELYGGYKNERGLKWDFSGLKKSTTRDKQFQQFAASLDTWFWRFLDADRLNRSAVSKERIVNKRVKKFVEIFLSQIGTHSISMVDPIFYYGSSIYRMPFRRDGGLERLHGLLKFYESLDEGEKEKFSFQMLKKINNKKERKELRTDCIRVVIFYYLTRLFASPEGNQAEVNTKIHLYPIDVGGVVIGAVGKVSYDLKEEISRRKNLKLATTRETWDEEVMFLSAVVYPIKASLRRQYRDLQVEYMTEAFRSELREMMKDPTYQKFGVSKTMLENFEKNLNEASDVISRACPYPGVKFYFDVTSEVCPVSLAGEYTIDFGEVKLTIQQEESPKVFRVLTRPDKRVLYDVTRSLSMRFHEVCQHEIPI